MHRSLFRSGKVRRCRGGALLDAVLGALFAAAAVLVMVHAVRFARKSDAADAAVLIAFAILLVIALVRKVGRLRAMRQRRILSR